MLSSQLSELAKVLNQQQIKSVENYVNSLSSNTKITVSKFSAVIQINASLASDILNILVKADILEYIFTVRCPECGLLLDSYNDLAKVEKDVYCYNCEKSLEIIPDDVEVIYIIKNNPFVQGQQNRQQEELVIAAVPQEDSLTMLLNNSNFNLTSVFYDPSDNEARSLIVLYNNVFSSKNSTTLKGKSLEQLTEDMFGLCKHFNVTGKIRLRPNQLDCYVRNKVCLPGLEGLHGIDSFIIECKNESKKPRAEYLNKLHSILKIADKRFGIIISRFTAPRTFIQLSNQIYLSDKIIIIALDSNDLKDIIIHGKNLLECIARKIDEVKLNATKDLKELGIYNA